MKLISPFFILIIFLSIKSIHNENCEMQTHKFFLLPIVEEKKPNYLGLKKFDYMLILKTEPKGNDCYHLVLNVTFPVNVVIDLSDEILYNFISLEKFCLLDLTKQKGRYVNIFGTISDYSTNNKILENVWIKVENVLLFKNIENDKKSSFYLLTNYNEYDKKSKRYFLMNKMYNNINQNFQIASVSISKERDNIKDNYECKSNELSQENELSIGDEISILNYNERLREDFTYDAYIKNTKYLLTQVDNFICIKYRLQSYDEQC